MKTLSKKSGALLSAVLIAFSATVGSGAFFFGTASVVSAEDHSNQYYYESIENEPLAQKFYGAFEALTESGKFKEGKIEYDLIAENVATAEQVAAYVNGTDGNYLAKSFGIGRDAFYMDHPDLFYADVFATSITAGQQGGNYVGFLDSSRVLTTYRGNLDTVEKVNAEIAKYNDELSKIVTEADKKGSVKEKIEYVNEYISGHNTYGYGTAVEGDRNVDTPKAAFIHTSYGALVNRESVCEGYAKSFKAVMDRLQIPCVCVQGYAHGLNKSNFEPHMWNYVQVDGMWYGVDVTFNATSGKNTWVLTGEQSMFDTHIPDPAVSSSGYELKYPALKPYDYGKDSDENGMTVLGSYIDTKDQGKLLELVVSYDGKGAKRLQDEGKYLVYRTGKQGDKENIEWSKWANVLAVNVAYRDNIEGDIFTVTDYDTTLSIATGIEFVQFAILNYAPDSYGEDLFTQAHIVCYDPANLTDGKFIAKETAPYRNNGYGTYEPSPGLAGAYPSNSTDLPVDQTYEIRLVYNTELMLADGKNIDDFDLDFYTSHGNSTVKDHAVIENLSWDGDKTITFTFTPSRMYIHNMATYYFTPVNLVGKISKKTPDPVRYSFKGKSVVCSKVFNDGRLYMNVFGQPSLLDNSDLSVTDFKDENGKYYAESQRSQLMLVASKPTPAKQQEMDEVLKEGTGIQESEIVASSTYEINLQLCGIVQKVPNGSYMQVAFGFPEGYSPDDAGTTFKIYHYKHDDSGNITGVEEIPVIVTEYGLIAKVSSFSPFTIVQVKNESAAVQNSNSVNVYAYVNGGVGGTVKAEGKGGGISEITGRSITYDITPDDGYKVAYVRLNGKVIDASYYQDGKLTLAKQDVKSSNMLEVMFVNEETANAYASKGISVSYGAASEYRPSALVNTAGIIFCCVAAVVALGAVAFMVWWFSMRNKEDAPEGAQSSSAKTGRKKSSSKSASKKK